MQLLNFLMNTNLFFVTLIFFLGIFIFNTSFLNPFNNLNPFSNFGKINSKIEMSEQISIKFSDVAGIDEAKKELEEVVLFLKEPKKFKAVGANIPRGILLVGPPGNGKTLLAKAVAGEANVPFFSVSGSEFVELFVGIGAARMRDLFEQAKSKSPCIIFIDEIDTIGRERGYGMGNSSDEKEQTLNQLLTELDGFNKNSGIIVLAATNRVDILDSALLRPGRFDRQVTVNRPSLKGRIEILKVHSKGKILDENISLQRIAQRTPGFSGADLANLLNESAILAAREKKEQITMDQINKSIDKVMAGLEGLSLPDLIDRRLVAYHEVGHGLIGAVLDSHDSVQKLTIIPRGRTKGLTWFTPQESRLLPSRSRFLNRLTSVLGGRVAEDLIFGNHQVTTAARGDIRNLTNIAKRLITQFGMSNVGPITINKTKMRPIFIGRRRNQKVKKSSEKIVAKIDLQIKSLIENCYQQALLILKENRFFIDFLAEELVVLESIEGTEFSKFLNIYLSPAFIKKYRTTMSILEENLQKKYTVY